MGPLVSPDRNSQVGLIGDMIDDAEDFMFQARDWQRFAHTLGNKSMYNIEKQREAF